MVLWWGESGFDDPSREARRVLPWCTTWYATYVRMAHADSPSSWRGQESAERRPTSDAVMGVSIRCDKNFSSRTPTTTLRSENDDQGLGEALVTE